MRITLYYDPDEPQPKVLEAGLDAAKAGRYSKRCKYHRDPWSLAAHWRVTFPVRDYLSRLAPKLRGIGDDFTLELADGTVLQGAEAVAYVRRYT